MAACRPPATSRSSGRRGATTLTVTRNEILYGLNQADKFILAVVLAEGGQGGRTVLHSAALYPGAGLGGDQHQSDLNELLGAG